MKLVICIGLIVFLSFLLLMQSLTTWDTRNVRDFQSAYISLLKDAAEQSCLTRSSILQAAKERAWETENNLQAPLRVASPDNWTTAVRVFVVPPLSFSKAPGVTFFFDKNDCMVLR